MVIASFCKQLTGTEKSLGASPRIASLLVHKPSMLEHNKYIIIEALTCKEHFLSARFDSELIIQINANNPHQSLCDVSITILTYQIKTLGT